MAENKVNLAALGYDLDDYYVFYNKFVNQTDIAHFKTVKQNYINFRDSFKHQAENYGKVISFLQQTAAAEKEKERSFLATLLGTTPPDYDLANQESVQTFIESINSIIQFKEVFNRNVKLAQHDSIKKKRKNPKPGQSETYEHGLKPILVDYLDEKLISNIQTRFRTEYAEMIKQFEQNGKNIDLFVDEIMNQALMKTLENLLGSSKLEGYSGLTGGADAYSQLLTAIQNADKIGNSPYLEAFKKALRLDELKSVLTDLILNKPNAKKKSQSKQAQAFRAYRAQRRGMKNSISGSISEVTTAVMSNAARTLESNFKDGLAKKGGAIQIGGMNAKTDVVITYGIELDPIINKLNELRSGSYSGTLEREKAVNLFSELSEKLEASDGFVVYVSNKSYQLTELFEKTGYSGGSSISLGNFENVFGRNIENIDLLVGALMQLETNAIGEKGDKDIFEKAIATQIAYFLFDDFTTIGSSNTTNRVLHLFDLNGIIIPISFLLKLLIQAIQTENYNDYKNIARISITPGKTIYSDDLEEYRKQTADIQYPWKEQQQHTLNNTKIKASFLKNFQSLLRQYLK